jgi:hypothetical protein
MKWEGNIMNKISGLARALGVVLAIVAGFVAIPNLNMALVLVVLGLIAGLTTPDDRFVTVLLYVLVLPMIGTALGNIPAVGAQLGAVFGGLAMLAAGGAATGVALRLYKIVMNDVSGLAGSGASGSKATA